MGPSNLGGRGHLFQSHLGGEARPGPAWASVDVCDVSNNGATCSDVVDSESRLAFVWIFVEDVGVGELDASFGFSKPLGR